MKLLSPAISRLARWRLSSLDMWRQDPARAQIAVWQDLIAAGEHTEFGRLHRFQEIESPAQFRERVPVHRYEDLQPYIERMMGGEENLLWNTPVSWFAKRWDPLESTCRHASLSIL